MGAVPFMKTVPSFAGHTDIRCSLGSGSRLNPKSVCHLNFINTRSFDDQDLIDIDGVGMILIGANREYIKTHPTSTADADDRPIQDVVR